MKHSWNALGKLCVTVSVSSQHGAVEKKTVANLWLWEKDSSSLEADTVLVLCGFRILCPVLLFIF